MEQTNPITPAKRNLAQLAGKYLTFYLDKEIYGIEILKVQEIIQMMAITAVPNTPKYARGMINLRDKVIPIIDLREKFKLASKDDTSRNCIILMQVDSGERELLMGIIIDEVSEVINITENQIEQTPSFGGYGQTDFILGIGKIQQKSVILLNVKVVVDSDEIDLLDRISKTAG